MNTSTQLSQISLFIFYVKDVLQRKALKSWLGAQSRRRAAVRTAIRRHLLKTLLVYKCLQQRGAAFFVLWMGDCFQRLNLMPISGHVFRCCISLCFACLKFAISWCFLPSCFSASLSAVPSHQLLGFSSLPDNLPCCSEGRQAYV